MFAKKAIVDFSKKATSLRGMTVRFNSNEGATGALRPNGSSDNFRKREQAQEDFYIKKQQQEQIAALKSQLAKQKKQLDKLEAEAAKRD